MKQYDVTGMSCAACSARVEKAVSEVPGVTSCSVSLLTNSMGVEGTASASAIIDAVQKAGYGASEKGGTKTTSAQSGHDEELKDTETPKMLRRLIVSVIFWVPLMYIMCWMLWDWPLPAFFAENHLALMMFEMLLTIIVMVVNQKFFISGFKGLIHRAPNMDTLVAMGAAAAFGYSTVMLFLMCQAVVQGDQQLAMTYMDEMYFESAATILTLITVGKTLESYSKGRTTDALKSLMKLAPKTATLIRDGEEVEVSIDEVRKGDIFVVRPGENIPVDGIVMEGHSAVNEAALTGESIPVDKTKDDPVSAATLNQSGFLRCEATRVGEDTTLSQIIQMVSDAAATKAPIAKIADRVSGVFVPIVITIAVVTIVVWLLLGQDIGYALARGISVLVISCPCSLGLATPVAIMVGNGKGARSGVLFKTAASLEQAGKAEIVALDKTGTITSGQPEVTDILPFAGTSEADLFALALALEQKSEHPLARAIMKKGKELRMEAAAVSAFQAMPGNGVIAMQEGHRLAAGNLQFIGSYVNVPAPARIQAEQLAEQGKTPLFFCRDQQLAGIIGVADVIKEDSPQAVRELQNMGIRVVMLTGDNARTAQAIGSQAGVDEVIAGVLPDGKENVIRQLQEQGKVAMVGDGINDAPALTRADIGIAIGAGTDVAIDAADVVLMKSRLSDVPAAIRLSRATLRNIHQNLFWAFFYNAIGIPLAAGLFVSFGLTLNPMFGAAAMSLSSVCVVSNALRLNLFDMRSTRKDKMVRPKADLQEITASKISTAKMAEAAKGEEETMQTIEKTMKIEGMMCSHCEASVKKALEAVPGVKSAEASAAAGEAHIVMTPETSEIELNDAIEAAGYTVKGEEETMQTIEKTMKVEGMMCSHCEASVKKALEAVPGVKSAEASAAAGEAYLIMAPETAEAELIKAVEAAGYTVNE